MSKEILFPVLLLVLACIVVATGLAGVALWQFSSECGAAGGSFSVEGSVAWCRY